MAGPRILISPDSLAYFGHDVVGFVEKNAQLQPYTVNIVTSADANGPEPTNDADGAKWRNRDTRLRQQFAEAAQADIRDRVISRIYDGAIEHSPANVFRPAGAATSADPALKSFVVSVAAINDPAQIFSRVSGVPKEHLQAVPGTTKDWRAWALMHESSHNRHDHFALNHGDVAAERQADIDANALYAAAHSQGIVSDAKLPDAMATARAMRYMRTPPETADYERRYALAGIGTIDTSSNNVILRQAYDVENAKNAVLIKIGEGTISNDDRLKARIRATQANVDDTPKALKAYVESGAANDPRAPVPDDVKTALRGMTIAPAVQAQIDRDVKYTLDRAAIAAGQDMGNKNPALLYATARTLDEQGMFKANAAQQDFIERFIKGARTYAPGYYKVPETESAPVAPARKTAAAETASLGPADTGLATALSAQETQALLARLTEQTQALPPAPALAPLPAAQEQASRPSIPSHRPDFTAG